jgi:Lon protease-like protein
MRRELPARPNLDHLKSQAKDLLDAHRRRDREALARIRSSVPAFANMSDDAIADAPFALHDAQSAIAREYGFASWTALRASVTATTTAPPETPTPPAVETYPTPATVPVLPVRNAVLIPGGTYTLEINRPTSVRAIHAAMAQEPGFLAVFAQRVKDTDAPTRDDLHAVGSLGIVHEFHDDTNPGSVRVEAVRWIALADLRQVSPYYLASVVDTTIDRGDEQQLGVLDRGLRDVAHQMAEKLGDEREMAHALIDATTDTARLADVVMAHLPLPVDEQARYAAETDVARRVQHAIDVLEAALRPT